MELPVPQAAAWGAPAGSQGLPPPPLPPLPAGPTSACPRELCCFTAKRVGMRPAAIWERAGVLCDLLHWQAYTHRLLMQSWQAAGGSEQKGGSAPAAHECNGPDGTQRAMQSTAPRQKFKSGAKLHRRGLKRRRSRGSDLLCWGRRAAPGRLQCIAPIFTTPFIALTATPWKLIEDSARGDLS